MKNKTMNLLQQALNSAQGVKLNDTRKCIMQAMKHLEIAQAKTTKKTQSETLASQWWNNIVANVGNSPVSKQTTMRCLKELDKMIGNQKTVIDQIEKDINSSQNQLLEG